MEDLKVWIERELPNDGEWWNDGYVKFVSAAEQMLRAGMSEETIKSIFREIYSAVCSEFGD